MQHTTSQDDSIQRGNPGQQQSSPVVLLMDDEMSILDSFGKLLVLKGYIVCTASDGEQALEVYRKALSSGKKVDVAVIDITIPEGMGGIETIKRLMVIDPGVIAIATTGHYKDNFTTDYKQYGFVGILPKPFILNELLEAIHAALRTGAVKRE